MTDEPLDLAPIDRHDRMWDDPENVYNAQYAMEERRALLAEVKRLRAQLADAWDEGHAAGIDYVYGTYTDNPYRTQPEETP